MGPSDSRHGRDGFTPRRASNFANHDGSPRFLGFSFPARCLQSPREACQLHTSVASLAVAGFVQSGGLTASTLCNEAEASSISLRLTGSPHRASPWGLLLSVPGWLHVGHLFDMLITFQIKREARLGLAHRISRILRVKTGHLGETLGLNEISSSRNRPLLFVRFVGFVVPSS